MVLHRFSKFRIRVLAVTETSFWDSSRCFFPVGQAENELEVQKKKDEEHMGFIQHKHRLSKGWISGRFWREKNKG